MTIPVLIPTRRRPHLLERQVKAIREQEGKFEPYYFLTWKCESGELEDSVRAKRLFRELKVKFSMQPNDNEYHGAETKSYDYDHLAHLWNVLLWKREPPFLLMGSDVLPGEPDTLQQLVQRLTPVVKQFENLKESIAVPVQVNEHGALNWFWAPAPGRREPYRATINNTRFREDTVDVERITGGIIAFNYNPAPLQPGPGSEFYHLKNPHVYLGRTGINIRPGQEWRIK